MKWAKFWDAAERRESVCEGSSGLGLEGLAAEEELSGEEDEEACVAWDGSSASLELAFCCEGDGGLVE